MFLYTGILLDHQSAICMDLVNEKGSRRSLIEPSRIGNLDHDTLANCIIEAAALEILTTKILIV
jgi:hypothetical protein